MPLSRLLFAILAAAIATTAQAGTIFVDDDNCPGPGSGTKADPYCSIQTAIDNAVDTDEVLVAPGTYFETINFLGKAVTLRSSRGPEVTTISATWPGTAVRCESGEGPDTVLSGFTITGHDTYDGTGMVNYESSPTVTNCTFSGFYDSGMSNRYSNPIVVDCTFSGNFGGIGGGMYNSVSSPLVINCTFSRNRAEWGGGMQNDDSSGITVVGCTFTDNTTYDRAGGMNNRYSSVTVTNCTFTNNTTDSVGGGMQNAASSVTVTNCIFWGGRPDQIYGPATVTYSNVQGGWPGDGNIDADPLFVEPQSDCCFERDEPGCANSECETIVCEVAPFCCDGYWHFSCGDLAAVLCGDLCSQDLRLLPGSPCIDAGDSTAVPEGITTDLDGNPRFVDDFGLCDLGQSGGVDAVVDIGAFEFQGVSPFVDCNHNGEPDTCDIANEMSPDCNANVVPDDCDLADGTSVDLNGNGVPDECDADCNGNGIPDEWDIDDGTSLDRNGNGVPDECDPDCNGNGIPDDCDIDDGTSLDCNGNGAPDECEIRDCNGNGIPDDCDIADGTSTDYNGDGTPDRCQCLGDASGNREVDYLDFLWLLWEWGGSGDSDWNNDGQVDVQDLLILLHLWGPCH